MKNWKKKYSSPIFQRAKEALLVSYRKILHDTLTHYLSGKNNDTKQYVQYNTIYIFKLGGRDYLHLLVYIYI